MLITGCSQKNNIGINPDSQIANPSKVYCEELGYEYMTVTETNGGQRGICKFSRNIECNSWDFFNGKCGQEYSYCEKHGGSIFTSNEKCQFSYECAFCKLANGEMCNEWDYFKGECPEGGK